MKQRISILIVRSKLIWCSYYALLVIKSCRISLRWMLLAHWQACARRREARLPRLARGARRVRLRTADHHQREITHWDALAAESGSILDCLLQLRHSTRGGLVSRCLLCALQVQSRAFAGNIRLARAQFRTSCDRVWLISRGLLFLTEYKFYDNLYCSAFPRNILYYTCLLDNIH